MSERKNPLNDFGIKIKMELLKNSRTQEWLIDEIVNRGFFMDCSKLNKIMTGQTKSSRVTETIKEILEIKEVQ